MEGPTGSHREEQRRQRRNNSGSEEIQESTEEDEGSEGWTDYLIRDFTVFGTRSQGYRNSSRVAVNKMVKQLCREEEVGFVDLWDSFVGKEEMYLRDGLHLSGKEAAVFCRGTVRGGCQWLC